MGYFAVTLFILTGVFFTYAFETGDKVTIENILARIIALENTDAVQRREIASLRTDFNRRENELLTKIDILTSKLESGQSKYVNRSNNTIAEEIAVGNTIRQFPSLSVNNREVPSEDEDYEVTTDGENKEGGRVIRRESSNNRIFRRQQTERQVGVGDKVAFFATLTHSRVNGLTNGHVQGIIFDKLQTNIGNSYNPSRGVFTAPVSGTYVFHATVVAAAVHNPDSLFYAEVDVNGHSVASFILQWNTQSSQMVVISLKTGDEVSIKNNLLGDSIVGNGFSSFSGFLLYESLQFHIVGK